MLAGNVKLKTFLGLLGLGGAVLVGGVGWWWSTRPAPPPPPPAPALAPAPAPPATAPAIAAAPDAPSTSAAPTSQADGALPHQADVLTWVGKDLGADKKKDTTKGRAWKVNVYQDAGNTSANRAKVDLDRDDRWDEKWTFEGDGRVSRQVAPADDEQYTETWVWNGQDWQREG
ncbi:hypothetical protein L6R53_10860 [Myxococcota bacterium]|nr:hypothetical protein [Myxococcota bacterium]